MDSIFDKIFDNLIEMYESYGNSAVEKIPYFKVCHIEGMEVFSSYTSVYRVERNMLLMANSINFIIHELEHSKYTTCYNISDKYVYFAI